MKATRIEKVDGGTALFAIDPKSKTEVQIAFCGDALPLEVWCDLSEVKKK
jgi:hypothetical protein